MGHAPGDDEEFGWEEYLLYNRKRGFVFLVDSTEGWSLLQADHRRTADGVRVGERQLPGQKLRLKESYESEVEYVAGEFYWQVQRGQTTRHREFASGNSLLS